MATDPGCERIQLELSIAHDEMREPAPQVGEHVLGCDSCTTFAANLGYLDAVLARGDFTRAPDLAPEVVEAVRRPQRTWWSVAAVALVGLVVGGLIGGIGTRLETGRAQDLDELFHRAGTALEGLTANLLVVERGLHEEVPERVYVGTIAYTAPEQLAIELVDTTDYPDNRWVANDVQLTISDGTHLVVAGSPCPVPALPECLTSRTARAVGDLAPFDDGILRPLELVGPGRSLNWPSGVEVLGDQTHQGRASIQVRSTVAAVELVDAILDHGAWRELHPTDPVVMWLDETTLVPIRIEVFAADSPERELWQLRRGYDDELGGEDPILIVEVSDLVTEPAQIGLDLPDDAASNGFVDSPVAIVPPELAPGFEPHRSGHRPLGAGGSVEAASWSDGRSWLMIEVTDDWHEPHLFGLSGPYVRSVDLGDGSIGYMAPSGNAVAVHGSDQEWLISGSVPRGMLVEVAGSLDVHGRAVPPDWLEASTVHVTALPSGTLAPTVEGWSTLARIEDDGVSLLMTSGGSRSVLILEKEGSILEPPVGPDVYSVEVRGLSGRYDAATGTLEWVENGRVIVMQSETVGMDDMLEIAGSLESR